MRKQAIFPKRSDGAIGYGWAAPESRHMFATFDDALHAAGPRPIAPR
jgi:hypothetical protein